MVGGVSVANLGYYGEAGIPKVWRKRVAMADVMTAFADRRAEAGGLLNGEPGG